MTAVDSKPTELLFLDTGVCKMYTEVYNLYLLSNFIAGADSQAVLYLEIVKF